MSSDNVTGGDNQQETVKDKYLSRILRDYTPSIAAEAMKI